VNLCTHCGHELPPRAKFCVRCGTPVTPVEPESHDPQVHDPQSHGPQSHNAELPHAVQDPEATALRSELASVLATPPIEDTGASAETLPREELQRIVAGLDDVDESETREQPRLLPEGLAVGSSSLEASAATATPPAAETPVPVTARSPARHLGQPLDPGPRASAEIAPGTGVRVSPVLPPTLELEPWLTDEIDELPDTPPAEQPAAPRRASPLARWRELRGKTRAGVLGGIAAVVVFIVMVTFIVVAQGAARGGASNPGSAVDEFAAALTSRDLGAALGMVAPDERDAFDRIRSAAAAVFGSLGLGDAVRAVDGHARTADLDLSLSGVTISVSGLEPVVSRVSADLAVARLARGSVRLDIDPEAAAGLLRTALAAQPRPQAGIHESFNLAAAGQSAPTLMLRRVSGLWYVSPLFTALEYTVGADGVLAASGTTAQLGADAGTAAAARSKGSASPKEAAEAFAKAFGAATSGDLGPLAATVQRDESSLVALYGTGLMTASGIPSVTVRSATFSQGAREGGRVQAVLDTLTGTIDGDPLEATSSCVMLAREETCLNGSGFVPDGTDGLLTLAADRGGFSVTTVQEADGWRVSLIDTAADHVIHWLRTLTREQALATLGFERATPTDVALVPDAATKVSFNSAGYATRTLRLSHSATVRWADSTVTATAYDAKGTGHFIGSWSGTDLTAGDYTLVLQAGRDWAREFAEKGNSVTYSATVRLLRL